MTTTKRINNPNKIDDIGVRAVTWGLLLPIGFVFFRNIRPYAAFCELLLNGQGWPWLWFIGGLLAFVAVQFFEIWPWLLDEKAPNSKRVMRNTLMIVAFGIDLIACYTFFPALREGVPDGVMILEFIDWGNVTQSVVTVFGLWAWFLLRVQIRKAV
jgi:hypothetical protein